MDLIDIRNDYGAFWGIVLILGHKSHRRKEASDFTKECRNYLIKVEDKLSKEYPNSGFGCLAKDYMSDVLDKLARFSS